MQDKQETPQGVSFSNTEQSKEGENMKYSIYIYEGDLSTPDLRENLMTDAVISYCDSHDIGYDAITVSRAEKGKPYIFGTEDPVYCNVSHTGNMWIAIVGPGECGIDLQQVTNCKYEQIARRYFSPQEQDYIRNYGMTGFFRLWVRREAFGKFTGEGFYGAKPPLVDAEGRLIDLVEDGFLKDLPIADDIICTYCTGKEEDDIEFFG